MRVILDITTLSNWHRPPVGIVRVELELAKYLLLNSKNIPCLFVCFSKDKKKLNTVNPEKVKYLIQRFDKQKNSIFLKWKEHIFQRLLLFNYYFKKETKKYFKKISLWIPHSLLKILKKTFRIFKKSIKPNNFFQFIKKLLKKKFRCFFFWRRDNTFNTLTPAYHINFNIKKNDKFIFVGLSWNYVNYELFTYMKKEWDISFISIVYDLIPLTHPNYLTNNTLLAYFFKHFYYLSYLCDSLSCISDFSKNEFIETRKKQAISHFSLLKTIPLGDNIMASTKDTKDNPFHKYLPKLETPYILFVSTVEIRKNHIVLLKAWLKAKEQSIKMPKLLCVGMMGWKIEDMLSLYENNPSLKKEIFFLNKIEDAVLAKLYEGCLFTVFPSYIEGWGLGAAESLAYGKICIISTAPALNEATRGIMPKVAPDDIEGWMQIIAELANNKIRREHIEQQIKETFIPRTWESFAKEFVNFALGKD